MDYAKVLEDIAREYKKILGNNLVGIYIHGSLAFGCFNPNKSDIDFIVVVKKEPILEEKEALIKTLLNLSSKAPKKGYEMSVVLESVCKKFVYPTPFELHYSNMHLQSCINNLREYCTTMKGTDKDLAAHFTIIKEVGYTLIGKPILQVFGEVPKENYLQSIMYDIEEADKIIKENPVYIILNLCRVLAFKNQDLILSKEQGGIWGIENLPPKYEVLIDKALENYQGDRIDKFEEALSEEFCKYMLKRIF